METQSTSGPDLGIINALKFTWNNQGRLFKLLAFPVLVMAVQSLVSLALTFKAGVPMPMPMSMPEGGMDMSTMPTAVALSPGQNALMMVLGLAYVMASLMMMVRLFRFHLLDEDATQTPFFSFGRREFRALGYYLLIVLIFAAVMGTLIAVPFLMFQAPILAGILGAVGGVFALYATFRLSFLFPAVSLDQPTSLSLAWAQMQGSVGTLFLKLFLAGLLMGLIIVVPVVAYGGILGATGFAGNMVAMGAIQFYVLWGTVISSSVTYRLVSNLYRHKVLDQA